MIHYSATGPTKQIKKKRKDMLREQERNEKHEKSHRIENVSELLPCKGKVWKKRIHWNEYRAGYDYKPGEEMVKQ